MLFWDLPFHLLSYVTTMPHHPEPQEDQKGSRFISSELGVKLEVYVASIEEISKRGD